MSLMASSIRSEDFNTNPPAAPQFRDRFFGLMKLRWTDTAPAAFRERQDQWYRALKPRDKARVERPMPYVRDSFWRGREFASLPQMQGEAVRWALEVAGRRTCRPLDGAAPAVVFEAIEKDALRPLPGEPFTLAAWATAKIGPDIHAQVGKVLYSVPWAHIGKTADVRVTGTMVQFFIGGQLVKTHPRKIRGADRLRRLPAGEDRVPHADPGLVPQASHGDRPGVRAGHLRAAR